MEKNSGRFRRANIRYRRERPLLCSPQAGFCRDAFDREERPFERHYFYRTTHSDDVPMGKVTVEASQGLDRKLFARLSNYDRRPVQVNVKLEPNGFGSAGGELWRLLTCTCI